MKIHWKTETLHTKEGKHDSLIGSVSNSPIAVVIQKSRKEEIYLVRFGITKTEANRKGYKFLGQGKIVKSLKLAKKKAQENISSLINWYSKQKEKLMDPDYKPSTQELPPSPSPAPVPSIEERLETIERNLNHALKTNKALGDEVSLLRMELDELKANK